MPGHGASQTCSQGSQQRRGLPHSTLLALQETSAAPHPEAAPGPASERGCRRQGHRPPAQAAVTRQGDVHLLNVSVALSLGTLKVHPMVLV